MPATNERFDPVKRGNKIRHTLWNKLARQVNALSNMGDQADGITTAAGKFLAIKPGKVRDQDIVLVRNDTGGDIDDLDHPVLGLGDPAVEPDDDNTIVHRWPPQIIGATPDDTIHLGKFAILDGPVKDGKFRKGIVSGMAWVRVYNHSDDHEYADIEDGRTDRLISRDSGSARIIWREDVDEESVGWALVRLSNSATLCVFFGPCAQYHPAVELGDSDFDVDFGGGCPGPNRYGASVVWPSNTFNSLNLEMQTSSPLVFSSNNITINCQTTSLTVYLVLTFSGLDQFDVELNIHLDSDDSVIATYQNSICSWLPLIGGYLQYVSGTCGCRVLGPEICLSPPLN